MTIEFMGIPGCGKTYLSDYLEKNCNVYGKCIDIIEKNRTEILYKFVFKFFKLLTQITPKYQRLRRELLDILKDYLHVDAKYETVNIRYYVDALVIDRFLHCRFKKTHRLYVISEGIAQELVNIINNFDVDSDLISQIISCLDVEFDLVYIANSIDDSIEAMEKRNRHVCYIDELKGDELREFLKSYEDGCEIVSNKIRHIDLNKYDDLNESMNKITSYLEKR